MDFMLRGAMHRQVVLVVDDEAGMRQLLADLLPAELGVRVVVANDGNEALVWLRSGPIDAVLLDLRMPKLDGFEVIRRIKAEPEWRGIPVLALTAAGASTIRDAVAEGADDWIAKPFELDELMARLRKWLGKSSPRARAEAN
jgi:two-component system phosphate regulon response regulator PhoB